MNLIGLIRFLISSDVEWLGRGLLKILRLRWHDRPLQAERGPEDGVPLPTGPFAVTRKNQIGDLLLWVPRHINSYLIDDLTGGYGYSHCSIDTGEIDIPTKKPVMIEITTRQTVMRKFQDEYEPRAFARIPISCTGIDVDQFVACVKSKMCEPYDTLDAITLGAIKDPAKEVCSGLTTDCLPEKVLQRIARAKRMGMLRRGSVSIHSKNGATEAREFISPNGFAEYYGAPLGKKLNGPNIVVQPRPVEISLRGAATAAALRQRWKLAAGVMVGTLLVFMVKRTRLTQ